METLGEQSAAGLGSKAGVHRAGGRPASPAAAAGLRPRDVIVGTSREPPLAGRAIGDASALAAALATGSPAGVDLVVVRHQARLRVHLKLH